MYYFSVPMVYKKDIIDELCEFNNSLTKSKIVAFYDALPGNCRDEQSGLEQSRGNNPYIKNLDEFCNIVSYIKDKGFNFIYLLNSPNSFRVDSNQHQKFISNIDIIINKLADVGCKSFRVCNTSIIQFFFDKYPELDIRTSTTLGYSNITQYKNLIKTYPNISEFCLHYENNRDFKLLKNLVKSIPNVTKECIVNELCIKGCPYRQSHYNSLLSDLSEHSCILMDSCYGNNCKKIFFDNLWNSICKSNIIFPWMLDEYSKIGINNFKIAGRSFYENNYYLYYKHYLRCIEDEDYMMNSNIFSLLQNQSYLEEELEKKYNIKVKDVIKYLPDIKYFVKNGHNCASVCEMECNYCFEKAKILNEKFSLN